MNVRETFAGRCISSNDVIPWWLPSSSDLGPCDFFLLGYLKAKVYQGKPRTIKEFKKAILREVAAILSAMLTNVMRNFNNRLQKCINVEGRQLPEILFHN